jgi:uncharacterized repeat protein (TIGR01451 family)
MSFRPTARPRLVSIFAFAVLISIVTAPAAHATVSTSPDITAKTDGRVETIVRVGDTIFVGGDFTHLIDPDGTSWPRNYLAAIDAFTGFTTSWNPNMSGPVFSLRLSPDSATLYAGGNFTLVGSVKRSMVASFDTTTGALTSWHPKSFNGNIRAMAATASSVYVGGAFTTIGGVTRTRLAALDPSTGALQSWAPTADKLVRRILVAPTRVYVAGNFTYINGVIQKNLAAIDPVTGVSIACVCHPGIPVLDLATDGTRLFAGAGGPGGTAYAYNLATGKLIWSVKGDGNVQAVAVFGPFVYVGGHFLKIANVNMVELVRLDPATGALDTSWRPVVTDHNLGSLGVFTIASFSSKLYVGGDFDRITSQDLYDFAQFTDSGVQNTADTSITMIDAPDPLLLGQNITYTLSAANAGPDGATGVTATDVLSPDLTFVSASSGCSYDLPSRTVTCSFGNLAPNGSSAKLVTATAEQSGQLPNSATVSSNEIDPQAANNTASVSTEVDPVPGTSDVAITQSPSADPVGTSQNLTYHLVANNYGPDPADNLTVTDVIPSTSQFVSATPSQGSCSGTDTIVCNIGTLDNGGQATIDLTVATPSDPMTITNSVSITGPALNDIDLTDNSSSLMTTVFTPGTGDVTPPQELYSQMLDTNANGRVDTVVVQFNEPLATCVAPCTAGWVLNNVPSDGTLSSVTTSGSQATLNITEGTGVPNTAVDLFTVELTSGNAIQDPAGNHATFAAAAPQDMAGPVPVAFRKGAGGPITGQLDAGDTITVEWSEDIAPASVPPTTTVSLTAPSGAGHDTLNVTGMFGAVMDTGSNKFMSVTDGSTASFPGSSMYLETPSTTTAKVAGACTGGGCSSLIPGPTSSTVVYVANPGLTDAAGNPAVGSVTKTMRLF